MLDRYARLLETCPDAKEQIEAGEQAYCALVLEYYEAHPEATQQEQTELGRRASEVQLATSRAVAETQRQRRIAEAVAQRGSRGPQRTRGTELRSVVDGWHWQGSRRRDRYNIVVLLVRVTLAQREMQIRSPKTRVSRAMALAYILADDLRTSDPDTHRQLTALQDAIERDERLSRDVALTRAIRRIKDKGIKGKRIIDGKRFRMLEKMLTEAAKTAPQPATPKK